MTTLLLKVGEAADQLRTGRDRIFELIKSGDLPAVKLGPQSTRIRMSDLEAYVNSLPAEPPSPA